MEQNKKPCDDLIAEIDAANTGGISLKVRNLVEALSKLARTRWKNSNQSGVWESSRPVWLEIQETIERRLRMENQSETTTLATILVFEAAEKMSLETLAWLADIATDSDRPQTLRNTARSAVEDRWENVQRNSGLSCDGAAHTVVIQALRNYVQQSETASPAITGFAREEPEFLAFWEIQLSNIPTLTSRGPSRDGVGDLPDWDFDAPGHAQFMHVLSRCVYSCNDAAVRLLFEILDGPIDEEKKIACLEALRLIGGCFVSVELSKRIETASVPQQILDLIAYLGAGPYQGPSENLDESHELQRDSAERVLGELSRLERQSYPGLTFRHAIATVERHLDLCMSYADPGSI